MFSTRHLYLNLNCGNIIRGPSVFDRVRRMGWEQKRQQQTAIKKKKKKNDALLSFECRKILWKWTFSFGPTSKFKTRLNGKLISKGTAVRNLCMLQSENGKIKWKWTRRQRARLVMSAGVRVRKDGPRHHSELSTPSSDTDCTQPRRSIYIHFCVLFLHVLQLSVAQNGPELN